MLRTSGITGWPSPGMLAALALTCLAAGDRGFATVPLAGGEQKDTTIVVRSVRPPEDAGTQRRSFVAVYGLTYADLERVGKLPDVTRVLAARIFPHQVRRLERVHDGRVVAASGAYLDAHAPKLAKGRSLTEEDDALMRNVVVLGSSAAVTLFGRENAVGETIRLGQHTYQVVGVFKEREASQVTADPSVEDVNGNLYIPLQTCKVRFGERIYLRESGTRSGEQVELSRFVITVREPAQVRPTMEAIRKLLEQHHSRKDWEIQKPLER